jgi:hypothetical protein
MLRSFILEEGGAYAPLRRNYKTYKLVASTASANIRQSTIAALGSTIPVTNPEIKSKDSTNRPIAIGRGVGVRRSGDRNEENPARRGGRNREEMYVDGRLFNKAMLLSRSPSPA